MKWAVRCLIRFYPGWWRKRFGSELEALVEESGGGWATIFDIAQGALVMRLKDLRTFPLLMALIGAAIGAVVVVRTPALYESTATIRLTDGNVTDPNSNNAQALRDRISGALQTEDARRATSVTLGQSSDGTTTLVISHTASEASTAQRVVAALVSSVANNTASLGTVLQPAVLPTAPSKAYGVVPIPSGAALGFALGACAVLVRRRFDSV